MPTGDDLRDYWRRELGEGGLRRMFDALVAAYPSPLSRAALGEAADLSRDSGTFGTYLAKLRTLELARGSQEIAASEFLFE